MSRKKKITKYVVRGKTILKDHDPKTAEIPLLAELFKGRKVIASASVKEDFTLTFTYDKELSSPLKLVIKPAKTLVGKRRLPLKQIKIMPDEWESTESFSIIKDIVIEPVIWECWWCRPVTIRGIVCKDTLIEGTTETKCCPVPHAEVEVFDVDPLYSVADFATSYAVEKPIVASKAPVLMKKPMFSEESNISTISHIVGVEETKTGYLATSKLEYLPWYTTDSLGKTVADECGEFEIELCWPYFNWPEDEFPDLIFKVSQTIGPAESPTTYTIISEGTNLTRWNVPDYLYVRLDADPNSIAACNPNCAPFEGKRTLWWGVGNQEIYTHIAQETTVLPEPKKVGHVYHGGLMRSPFGAEIKLRAAFGADIEDSGPRFYRILYVKIDNENVQPTDDDWLPITSPLGDKCIWLESVPGVGSVVQEKYVGLGPKTINGNTEYYEFRASENEDGYPLSWFDENKIGEWFTTNVDDGLYVLRLEVVDSNGNVDNAIVHGDDLGKRAKMFVHINNKTPVAEILKVYKNGIQISEVCGSFQYESGDSITIEIDAYHPDDYLHNWNLRFQVGLQGNSGVIASEEIISPEWKILGKRAETVAWTTFASDLQPGECSVFGIALELNVKDNVTNGEGLLGSYQGHVKEDLAGLAVSI